MSDYEFISRSHIEPIYIIYIILLQYLRIHHRGAPRIAKWELFAHGTRGVPIHLV